MFFARGVLLGMTETLDGKSWNDLLGPFGVDDKITELLYVFSASELNVLS